MMDRRISQCTGYNMITFAKMGKENNDNEAGAEERGIKCEMMLYN
jgi:hypothetical protein